MLICFLTIICIFVQLKNVLNEQLLVSHNQVISDGCPTDKSIVKFFSYSVKVHGWGESLAVVGKDSHGRLKSRRQA